MIEHTEGLTNIKIHCMPEIQLKQLQSESESWKRILGCMIEENINFKNKVTEIVKNGIDKSQLEEVEEFQNNFIQEDALIGLMRNEVAAFDKLILRLPVSDGSLFGDVYNKLTQLRHNITVSEGHFSKLRTEFNVYLLNNIQA
jgi:hypothetical protein